MALPGFYTDYLWFDSLGYTSVWSGVLAAKVVLALVFITAMFILLWVNLYIADRIAPSFRPPGPEEEFVRRYHDTVGARAGLVRVGVAALFALFLGAGTSGRWQDWILFRNGGDFGIEDAQFGIDIGFYVFELPFIRFFINWLFTAFVVVLIITAAAHYLNGGIRMNAPSERVTPQVKRHLSFLLAVLALIKATDYWYQRYSLNFSSRGVVDGASYTDVNAQLPAIKLLILISLCAAVLLIVNIWRRGWVLPVVAVGLWAFVAVVMGSIYPAIFQRLRVEPSELAREGEFIDRNIDATRLAFGLGELDASGNVIEVPEFPFNFDPEDAEAGPLTPDLLAQNANHDREHPAARSHHCVANVLTARGRARSVRVRPRSRRRSLCGRWRAENGRHRGPRAEPGWCAIRLGEPARLVHARLRRRDRARQQHHRRG